MKSKWTKDLTQAEAKRLESLHTNLRQDFFKQCNEVRAKQEKKKQTEPRPSYCLHPMQTPTIH